MKTLADLLTFIDATFDATLAPEFDLAAAVRRLGAINCWVGELACLESAVPAIRSVVVETARGREMGVQADLVKPLDVTWEELERVLGPRRESPRPVDAWTGPQPYEFERKVERAEGMIFLDITDQGETARIERFVARRPYLPG
jgi:hypothetical protein